MAPRRAARRTTSDFIDYTAETELEKADYMKVLNSLADAAAKEVKKGKFIVDYIVEAEFRKSDCVEVLTSLANVAAQQAKSDKFVVPGVVVIKTREKPATKAGKREQREMFGKAVVVKTKPAETAVKAFPVVALKAVDKMIVVI